MNSHGRTGHFDCPINANASQTYFEDHFFYEGWTNLYGTTKKPVCKSCYFEQGKAANWMIKESVGAIQLDSLNANTFRIVTYYLDQDSNFQNLTDLVTIE